MVWLTPDFAIAPQPAPQDMAALAAAGFGSVICNRPDDEVPPGLRAADLDAAARAAGLDFAAIPVHHAPIADASIAAEHRALSDLPGPHFAYCRSGYRSSVIWALALAGDRPTDALIEALAQAGFDVPDLRDAIEARAAAR